MASVESRDILAEAARLEAAARGAGAALACIHETADELHRALVREYLARRRARGLWGRTLSLFSL